MARFIIPTGELREPIVLVRSKREPSADADWSQTLTPYANAWAKKELGKQSFVKKENAEAQATHIFWIRDMHLSIEARDYVKDGDDLYAIIGTEPKGEDPRFIKISTRFHRTLDAAHPENQSVVINNPPAPPVDDASTEPSAQNGFWFGPPPSS